MIRFLTTFICSFFLFVSCSSDESTSKENDESLDPSQNSITIEGDEFLFTQAIVTRSGDEFSAVLYGDNGEVVSIPFHKDGNYGNITYISNMQDEDGFIKDFQSLDIDADSYFSFEVVNIDTSNNSVSIKFDGTLHIDGSLYGETDFINNIPAELNEQVKTTGSLNLNYEVVTPGIEGLEVSAFIDGEKWYALDGYTSGLSGITNVIFTEENNTNITLSLVLDTDNIEVGTYNFSNSSSESSNGIYRMYLTEFFRDGSEFTSVNYVCSGTLTINSIEKLSFGILRAEFDFTAQHPDTNEEIKVTSGIFNTVFFL